MVDFRKAMLDDMTSEKRVAFLEWEASWNQREHEFKQLTDENMANTAAYYWKQSGALLNAARRHVGFPVYDSVLMHIILPEMIRRLKRLG